MNKPHVLVSQEVYDRIMDHLGYVPPVSRVIWSQERQRFEPKRWHDSKS